MSTENPSPRRRSHVGRIVFLLLSPPLGAVLGLLVAGVFAYLAPKKFESTCVVQISPPQQSLTVFGGGGGSPRPSYLATEFEMIKSDLTLDRVAKELELPGRWKLGSREVVDRLRELVTVEAVAGTDLTRISVRHVDRAEARELAAAIADVYIERRSSQEDERAELALAALDGELRDQEVQVEEKRKIMYAIAEAIGIPHYQEDAAGGGEFSLGAERELFRLENEIQQGKVRLATLARLEGEELFKFAAGIPTPNNGLAAMLDDYREQIAEAKELGASGLGPNHPRARAQAEKIAELADSLGKGVEAVGIILQTELDLGETRLARLRKEVNERRELVVNRALESPDYLEAKQEYENARAMLEKMGDLHASSRIALKIPRQPVTIHEEAREGRAPVSPRIGLMLAGGGGAGMLIGGLVGVFVFFLAGRK